MRARQNPTVEFSAALVAVASAVSGVYRLDLPFLPPRFQSLSFNLFGAFARSKGNRPPNHQISGITASFVRR
jgi:hypothetical protein